MFENTAIILSTLASILTIINFFKEFIKHKWIVASLSSMIAILLLLLLNNYNKRSIEIAMNSSMKEEARIVVSSINNSGFNSASSYYAYLMTIASFYKNNEEKFTVESENYTELLRTWGDFLNDKIKNNSSVMYHEYKELEKVVIAGKEHLNKIAQSK